jgi:hypothetical protein
MTTTPTASGPILAVDVGKYKSVACARGAADQVEYRAIGTGRAERVRLRETRRPGVVLVEACPLAGWVRDRCAERGVPCLVANTPSGAWKFKHLKRKTDRGNAPRPAEVYRLGKSPEVAAPEEEVRERRGLTWRGKRVGSHSCATAIVPFRLPTLFSRSQLLPFLRGTVRSRTTEDTAVHAGHAYQVSGRCPPRTR